ncbi:MAG: hydroxyquinol 1,2-dioxygenase [Pseudonocardiales bacterium]|nr:hydroxyquinol 1,2-dioxygenase [Pseudonocardiales bacterium]
MQKPDGMGIGDLCGLFTADQDGRYWFRSIMPSHYPIPADGPVGMMLRQTGRHEFRPAHSHFEVGCGSRRVEYRLNVSGDPDSAQMRCWGPPAAG